MLVETGINPIDTQEFTDIPISIDGVVVGVLLREMTEPNWIKVSLRSRNGFDVNTVANKFGEAVTNTQPVVKYRVLLQKYNDSFLMS